MSAALDVIHTYLLLGVPVDLPPGTVVARRLVSGVTVFCEVARRSHTTAFWKGRVRVLCRFDHSLGHDCVWLTASEIDHIVSLPDGCDAETLLKGDQGVA